MESRETFTEKEAEEIVRKWYGIEGKATRQGGECDFNFLIKTASDIKFIAKISYSGEAKLNIEMQNDAINWLAANTRTFAYPGIIKTTHMLNAVFLPKTGNFVRLFKFVPGTMLINENHPQNDLFQSFGTQLAELTIALKEFNHPAAKRYHSWDLAQAEWIKEKLSAFTDNSQRECMSLFLDRFTNFVKPMLNKLPHSVIHGDVNTQNILVTSDFLNKRFVSGFIDFGDMVHTATVCELAIGIAYVSMLHHEPLQAAKLILENYHKKSPLQEAELDVLFDLICIRLCISAAHAAVNRQNDTTNPHFSSSEKDAWRLLKQFKALDRQEIASKFKEICGFSKPAQKMAYF